MFASGGSERLERALHDSLATNVNPRTGGHLSVHGKAHFLEAIEFRVVRPLTDKIGIRDQNARSFFVRPKFSHGLSRLDKERLVVFEIVQGLNDRVESLPAPGGATCSAINDKPVWGFGYIRIEIVHQHPHRGFLMPAFATALGAARGVADSFSAHHVSYPLSKSPRRIATATRAMSPATGRPSVRGRTIALTTARA